jgi:hypothetical protein
MHLKFEVKLADLIKLNIETIMPSTNLTAKMAAPGIMTSYATPLLVYDIMSWAVIGGMLGSCIYLARIWNGL